MCNTGPHYLQKRPRLDGHQGEGSPQHDEQQQQQQQEEDQHQQGPQAVQFLVPRRAEGVCASQLRKQRRDRPEAAPRNQLAADGGPSPNDLLETRLEGFRQAGTDKARQCHVSPNSKKEQNLAKAIGLLIVLFGRNLMLQEMIDALDLDEAKRILHQLADSVPRNVYLCLSPPPPNMNRPGFCQCGNCTVHPNARMNFCCSQRPCVSRLQTFSDLCLNFATIAITGILNYATTMKDIPDFSPNIWRNQSYRFYTLWQHAKLPRQVRRCPPSCVVSTIRNQFPQTEGEYTGYESVEELLSDVD